MNYYAFQYHNQLENVINRMTIDLNAPIEDVTCNLELPTKMPKKYFGPLISHAIIRQIQRLEYWKHIKCVNETLNIGVAEVKVT